MEEKRIVLVPCPFQGHINPMLELGTALYSKGFAITIIHTEFNSPNNSNHPEFTFLPISDNLTDSDKTSEDLLTFLETINTKCEAPMEECLAKIIDKQESQSRLVCIINDVIMYVGETVAKKFDLPSIMLYTCSPSAMVAYSLIPQLQEEGYLPYQDSMLKDLIPGSHILRFKDLPLFNFGTTESLLKLIEIVCNIRTTSAIIWNTVEELEHGAIEMFKQQYKVPSFSIGPLFKFSPFSSSSSMIEEDATCIEWLDKFSSHSILYISFGSIIQVDEKALIEMSWGLAHSKQPFLWVLRPGFVLDSVDIKLPEGFQDEVQERGLVVKWAPQKKVLSHRAIGGFWTHCGWNSTLESIGEGVPMICSPGFGDQRVNERYISNVWKVGLEIEMDGKLERGKIEKEVRRLMVDQEGEDIRKRANEMKETIDICVNKGGSSYHSLNELAEYISCM